LEQKKCILDGLWCLGIIQGGHYPVDDPVTLAETAIHHIQQVAVLHLVRYRQDISEDFLMLRQKLLQLPDFTFVLHVGVRFPSMDHSRCFAHYLSPLLALTMSPRKI